MACLPENWESMTPDEQEDWLMGAMRQVWHERQEKELPKTPVDEAKGRVP